jgi:prolipoprotein diacylglyceryltransferase
MYAHFDSETWLGPFGLIFIAAVLTAWLCARRNAAVSGIDVSEVDLLMPVILMVGVAGGSLVALVLPVDNWVIGDLLDQGYRIRLFAIPATAAATLYIYSRLNRLSFRCLLDIFALPTMVGLMIHRVGCFFAGCCWGDIVSHDTAGSFTAQVQTLPIINNLTSGVQYPPGSLPFEQHVSMGLIDPAALSSLPVVPVQLYEAALILVVVLALWRFPWREYPRGSIAVLVTCSYALLRFFLEYLRADGHIIMSNLTVTQLQCLLLLSSSVLLPGMLRRPATNAN